MSGYHIAYRLTKTPVIAQDGGTGSWRDAKKFVRQWYLDQAYGLRNVTRKEYFKPVDPAPLQDGAGGVVQASA